MKRLLLSLALATAAGMATAQAPFTIVRPADGAKVREDVRILIPKNSVPKTGYVGFFLDGKFLEATVPNLSGRYYEYLLDTKKEQIEDGKHTLEAVLYVDYSDEPRIVDRSSVTVTVANSANIPIPKDGLLLRYHFKDGQQLPYTVLQSIQKENVSVNAAALGLDDNGPTDYEKIRMTYSVDNVSGNGDALIRMQAGPLKNKLYVNYTPPGGRDPQVFWAEDFAPLYMQINNVGYEVFGSVPQMLPWENVRPTPSKTEQFYADWPLPTLPVKRVRPGDAWQTRFQLGREDLRAGMAVNSIVNVYPARGEFEDVEWEMGHPCAKLVTSIVEGQQSPNQPRVDMSETVWFALDKGEVIKIVRDQTYDSATVGGAPAGGGGPSKRGGPTKSAPPPRGGGNRGRGGKFGGGGGGINLNTPESSTPLMQNGKRGGFAGTGAGKAVQRSQNGRFTGGRTPTGGGRPTGAPSFGRLSIERIFILDM